MAQERQTLEEQLREANERLLLGALAAQHAAEREKALREQLETERARLEAVLRQMPSGVIIAEAPSGRVIMSNEQVERIWPAASRHLQSIADYRQLNGFHPDGRPYEAEEWPLVRSIREGAVIRDEEMHVRRDDRPHAILSTSAAPIRDHAGRIVAGVLVFTDITERGELDRLKDEFISVAAHELKTPVAIMKGFAQAMLRPEEAAAPRQRRMLEAIARGADRIDNVVKDLLDISKLHTGRLEMTAERIDLPQLVKEVAERIALTATKHRIRMVKAVPAVVRGDRDRLEQVLTNLLDNAMKYSPNDGDIDVAVTVRRGEAIVSVRDYGVGISKDRQARIFQPFYSAHTGTPYDYGGMGVGLYISKEIVTRHSGRIWLQSEAGKGSTFYFSLPLTK